MTRLYIVGGAIGILCACALAAEPRSLSGRVVYEDGRPAVGAYVIGMWIGAEPVAGSHSCYRAVVTQSDANGQYRITAQDKSANVVDIDTEAVAFMPGHLAAKENDDRRGLLIGPIATDKKVYFKYVWTIAAKLSCAQSNWQTSNMSPLAHLLISEMNQSATTPVERSITDKMADGLIGGPSS